MRTYLKTEEEREKHVENIPIDMNGRKGFQPYYG